MPIIPINSLCLDSVFGVIEKQQVSDKSLATQSVKRARRANSNIANELPPHPRDSNVPRHIRIPADVGARMCGLPIHGGFKGAKRQDVHIVIRVSLFHGASQYSVHAISQFIFTSTKPFTSETTEQHAEEEIPDVIELCPSLRSHSKSSSSWFSKYSVHYLNKGR